MDWEYNICKEDEGKTLEQILRAAGFSKKEISRQKFLPGGITLDGTQCRVNKPVHTGQKVVLRLKEDVITENASATDRHNMPSILLERASFLIADKPSGLSCHAGRGHYGEDFGTQISTCIHARGEGLTVRQIGRLDKDTSGLVVFAKSKEAAARLWKQRQDGSLKKTYFAVVRGRLKENEGVLDNPIDKILEEKNKMCVCTKESGKGLPAVTHYEVLKEGTFGGDPVSLVACRLETGRTHQIRVHFSAAGHPLLGDPVYGKEEAYGKKAAYGMRDGCPRLCLHAGEISFLDPFTKEKISVYSRELPFEIKEGECIVYKASDFSY